MSEIVSEFSISLERLQGYEFVVKFDRESHPDLHTDEGPPLGKDTGPGPSRLLAAAIGNCLAASFVFACSKAGVPVGHLNTKVNVKIARNANRRLRIAGVEVQIDPGLDAETAEKAKGAREVFEDFCTVTQSIRDGIHVEVKVKGIDV